VLHREGEQRQAVEERGLARARFTREDGEGAGTHVEPLEHPVPVHAQPREPEGGFQRTLGREPRAHGREGLRLQHGWRELDGADEVPVIPEEHLRELQLRGEPLQRVGHLRHRQARQLPELPGRPRLAAVALVRLLQRGQQPVEARELLLGMP
jgi:hypothetical protein